MSAGGPEARPRWPSPSVGSVVRMAALMTVSGGARAQGAPSRTSSLSWVRLEGAESCIATQALANAVEERLKRKVELDFGTARRLFTLVTVLHWKG